MILVLFGFTYFFFAVLNVGVYMFVLISNHWSPHGPESFIIFFQSKNVN